MQSETMGSLLSQSGVNLRAGAGGGGGEGRGQVHFGRLSGVSLQSSACTRPVTCSLYSKDVTTYTLVEVPTGMPLGPNWATTQMSASR